MRLLLALPPTLILLLALVPAASACPIYVREGPGYDGTCLDQSLVPVYPYVQACSGSLVAYGGSFLSVTLGNVGSIASGAIRTVDNVVFGAPC